VDQKTTLTATGGLLIPGQLVGRTVAFGTSNGAHRQALVLANSVTQIVVEDLDGTIAALAVVNTVVVASDYHLQSTSGAINKGTNSGAPATDIDGNTRPQGAAVEIGVDEFVPGPNNQAPINTIPAAQSVLEDNNLVFSLGNLNKISIADVDAGINQVRVTLTATNGLLSLSGTTGLTFLVGDGVQDGSMTFVGTIVSINTALDGMTYAPNANFSGAASLTITTNDLGNTGNNGPLSDTDVLTINVTAVNDGPVNTVPGAQQTPENTPLIFSAGTGNTISVADVDVATNLLSTTLVAANGKITLATGTGLTFSQGGVSGSSVVSFQATLSALNTALQGMSFVPNTGVNGAASLTITVRDNGFTGLGGAQTDSDTIAITINPVDHTPQLANVAITQNVVEQGTATLTGQIVDLDLNETYTLTVNWGDGSSAENFNLAAGATSFLETHIYSDDNPSGTSSDTYTVQVSVVDATNLSASTSIGASVNNAAPVITSFTVTPALNEGTTASAALQFTDAGTFDSHSVNINWGDGNIDSFNLGFGTLNLIAQHRYDDDGVSLTPADDYVVQVTVNDDDLGTANGTSTATVSNVAPFLTDVSLPLVAAVDGEATLTATILDPGIDDTFDVIIDWGDGNTDEIPLDAGTTDFEIVNTWAAPGTYTVNISISDDDGGNYQTTRSITINDNLLVLQNVAATSPVNEGSSVTLTGNIGDSNPLATLTLTVNWGEGSPQIIPLPAGSSSFSVQHLYADDNPSGTASDPKVISVQLDDSDLRTQSTTANTTVVNVAPQLSGVGFAANINEGGTATLNGNIADISLLDTFQLDISWGDGSSTETVALGAASTAFSRNHQYTTAGNYQATVVLTDDDTGSAQAQAGVTVNAVVPGTINMNSLAITSPINEGSSGNLTATIAGTTPSDSFTLEVNWGDGGGTQTVSLASGATSFSVPHVYADDNPTATPSDSYQVTVFLKDSSNNAVQQQVTTTVNNVAPQVGALINLASSFNEGALVGISTPVSDDGADTFQLTINWGDGSSTQTSSLSSNPTFATGSHTYAQNGVYQVRVAVTDDDGGMTVVQGTATINNVAPTLTSLNLQSPVNIGSSTGLSGNINDSGTQDSFQISINWGDGSGVQTINRPAGSVNFSTNHTYADAGVYSVQVTVQDSDGGSNSYNLSATVAALADVSITKNAPANTQPNGNLNYTIVVTNNGPSTAHNVVVDDVLPASVNFTNVTSTQGSGALASGTVHVDVGNLINGQSATVTIFTTVSGSASGTISNTATADADEVDSNNSNNSANASSTVQVPSTNADLQLGVSVPANGAQGLPLTYTLTVTNNGPVTATNVVVTDLLPNSVEFISATGGNASLTGGVFEGGVVTANFASIASGANQQVTITVRPFVAGALSNSPTVSGDQFDPNLSNNGATGNTTIAQRSAPDFQAQYIKIPVPKCSVKNGVTKCSVKGQLAVTNPGLVTTQTIVATVLLSNDGLADGGDLVLKTSLIKTIKAGKTKKLKISVKPPVGTSTSGKFLLVTLDTLDQVTNEIRERNNLIQFGPMP
jgi:uncharacterized repeat protein (TIGR01451 family)